MTAVVGCGPGTGHGAGHTLRIVGQEGGDAGVALFPRGPTIRVATEAQRARLDDRRVTVTLPAGAARVLRPHEPSPATWSRLPGVMREMPWLAAGSRLVVETPAPIVALTPWHPMAAAWAVGERAVAAFAPEAAYLIREPR